MGYYVNIQASTAVLPAKHLEEAHKRMCALDKTHDKEKSGGSWSGGKQTAKWFSWMDQDYATKCKTANEILEMLGFELHTDDDGNVHLENYDSKTGQEDLFLKSIGDLLTGYIEWRGEDGAMWKNVFGPKGMKTLQGKVSYE